MLILLFNIISLFVSPEFQLKVAAGDSHQIPQEWSDVQENETPKIGNSYWLKVNVKVVPGETYTIQGGNWYMQSLTFHDQSGENLKTGNQLTFKAEQPLHSFYIFYPFPDEKNNETFPIEVETESAFLKRDNSKNVFQAVFQASLFFPFMVALSFLIMTKEKVYLYYALYIFTVMGFFGYQYGLVGNYLPIVNTIPPTWFWLFGFTITLFYALFSVEFLDLKNKDPLAWKIVKIGIGYMFLLFLISTTFYVFRIDAQHSYFYKIPTIAIELVLILALLYRITLLKGVLKNYYLAGAFLLIGISIVAQVMSTAQIVDNFNRYVQLGLLAEVFILSLGLGVRVYKAQKEKNKVQESLIEQLQLNENLRKEYTDQLEEKVIERTQSLNEKKQEVELLLKEVHHRVKNNLQMITSLINLQARRNKDESLKTILNSTKQKIKSISLIHEHLYQAESLSQIKLDEYVQQLIDMNIAASPLKSHLDLTVDVPPMESDIATTIPIGLMLNELIINSLKYAYEKVKKPKLKVSIFEGEGSLNIQVWDNGEGFDDSKSHGLGHTIINSILETQNGERSFKQTNDGFLVSLADEEIHYL